MPRRVSLPGADELFRTTGGAALQAPSPTHSAEADSDARSGGPGSQGTGNGTVQAAATAPAPARSDEHTGRDGASAVPPGPRRPLTGERAPERNGTVQAAASATPVATATVTSQKPTPPPITATPQPAAPARRKAPRQNRRPSGRERHDEKITVYVSAEELMDLEHARLVLRGEHGLAIDRGRIVREAVAVVLADLESRGDASILVRRLRGR
ncbi:hypothetical protein SAMN05216223_106445 [Actinacidiphila yanglinensis]|uniref:Cobyrinic acid a,c-diamide synthase n=1 Tax=Actinacidiphila yanglinensis TaxID=310779 RepID=A0A1H6BEC4_9ACTN|nr:hypothetical protein [Actinacidiphila yanglinensis]SEG58607.1 hypothetical protein SAMN05216223_106445 [Actinacidiphila yanglinensis]